MWAMKWIRCTVTSTARGHSIEWLLGPHFSRWEPGKGISNFGLCWIISYIPQSDIWWAVSSESKNCPTLVCSSVGQVWLSKSTHLMVIRVVPMVGNYGSQKIKITSLSVVSNPKGNTNLATSRFQTVSTLCFSHKMCNTTRVFFPGVANSMFPLVNCVNYIHVIVTPEIFHPSFHLKLLRVNCFFKMP